MTTPAIPLSVLIRVQKALDSASGIYAQPVAEQRRIAQELAETNGVLSYWLDRFEVSVPVEVEQ